MFNGQSLLKISTILACSLKSCITFIRTPIGLLQMFTLPQGATNSICTYDEQQARGTQRFSSSHNYSKVVRKELKVKI